MRADIVPGGTLPDYELTDHAKTRRRLSDLQGNDPMMLVLARGHFCPKDHQQHLELAAWQPQIAVAYTRIVTISTDNIVESREFRASVGTESAAAGGRRSRRCPSPPGRAGPCRGPAAVRRPRRLPASCGRIG